MDKKQIIFAFLKTQLHMVVSTVNKDNNPESALVGFGYDVDLSLIFGTYTTTRKYKNILNNPHIAIVFGNEELVTVQYEGVASELKGQELVRYKKIYFTKNPESKKYETHENQVYLKVIPKWIRYTDFNKEPEEIFEIAI